MPNLGDKLRAICHILKMTVYNGIEEAELEKIRKRIHDLPSPERISDMSQSELLPLRSVLGKILDDLDMASPNRGIGAAIRYHIDKNLPPYRKPLLGMAANWYKRAGQDYGKTLSPDWHVTQLNPKLFRLSYEDVPILDFMLGIRPDGSYDGDITEVKVHGNNYWERVPKGVRPPMTIEIFSRAKDIIMEGSRTASSDKTMRNWKPSDSSRQPVGWWVKCSKAQDAWDEIGMDGSRTHTVFPTHEAAKVAVRAWIKSYENDFADGEVDELYSWLDFQLIPIFPASF